MVPVLSAAWTAAASDDWEVSVKIKPAQARREAQRALEHVREGIDPADLKRSRRDSRLVTFGDLVTEYMERHARPNTRASTFAQTRR